MLCLIQAIKRAPDADFLLLSAMLTNANDLAWLQEISERPCVLYQDSWKPSRQARGVVVYPNSDLAEIKRTAQAALRSRVPVRRKKDAVPFALFGLRQNWNATAAADIKLIKLTDASVQLAVSRYGYARPNSNSVAKHLAVEAAAAGLKTIVFVQQPAHAVSTARKIADDLEETPSLTDSESSMWSDVQAELGGEQYSLLSPLAAALPHNGDMIPLERRLAEALFRRESGASVIVATPTLAQGMNLPAQLAILAGDKRHDDDVGRRALEPHEILNAAGRAGRAGHLANGVVLLIPEPVLSFAENNAPEPDAFDKLRAVLPSDDKCVVVEDPITAVLDRIQSGNTADLQVQYFLSRVQAADDPAEAAENVLAAVRRSFSRFLAVKSNDQAVFDAKIEALSAVIAQEGPTNPSVFATGASHGIAYTPLLAIHDRLAADPTQIPQSIVAWSDWLIDFFAADRASYAALMESDVSTALYVMRGSKQGGPLTNQEFAKLRAAMRLWLSGRPYSEIEVALGATAAEIKNCPRTRDLILKLANRRLYLIFSSVAEIAKQIYSAADIAVPQMSVLETLAVAIRKGFDTPDKVAYDHIQRTIRSRVVAHASFANAFPTPLMLQGQSYQIVMDQVSMRLLGARTR